MGPTEIARACNVNVGIDHAGYNPVTRGVDHVVGQCRVDIWFDPIDQATGNSHVGNSIGTGFGVENTSALDQQVVVFQVEILSSQPRSADSCARIGGSLFNIDLPCRDSSAVSAVELPHGHLKSSHRTSEIKLETITLPMRRHVAVLFALAAIAFALLVSPAVAVAQDGAQEDAEQIVGYVILGEEIAGPYLIQVQLSPGAPQEGIVRFAVRIRDSQTGEDIDDAIVRVFGTPSEQGEKQYTPGLNSPFDPVFYLAQLELENAGIWAIDVEVESELGSGATVLSLRVNPRTRGVTEGNWGTILFLLVSLAFVSGASWLWYSSKKARRG